MIYFARYHLLMNHSPVILTQLIGDTENQRDLDSINHPYLQDQSSIAALNSVQSSRLRSQSI
ncbi:hypothetical protein GGS24DRAFT_36181 [Hypoxylon argillaceum]|nr:hypothetical protein GGS24DRAFT_36181 [Hypoxylon argillaceum]